MQAARCDGVFARTLGAQSMNDFAPFDPVSNRVKGIYCTV